MTCNDAGLVMRNEKMEDDDDCLNCDGGQPIEAKTKDRAVSGEQKCVQMSEDDRGEDKEDEVEALDLSSANEPIPVKKRRMASVFASNNNNSESFKLVERTAPVVESGSGSLSAKAFDGVAIQDSPLALTKNEK